MTDTYTTEFLDVFGETVTYLPAGGGSRSIKAIVDREMPAGLPGVTNVHTSVCFIEVANDVTVGISTAELNTGGDKVSLKVRINEIAQQRRIVRLIKQDEDMIRLELN